MDGDATLIARHSVHHNPDPHVTRVVKVGRNYDRDLSNRVETRHWSNMLNRQVDAADRRIALDEGSGAGIEVTDK